MPRQGDLARGRKRPQKMPPLRDGIGCAALSALRLRIVPDEGAVRDAHPHPKNEKHINDPCADFGAGIQPVKKASQSSRPQARIRSNPFLLRNLFRCKNTFHAMACAIASKQAHSIPQPHYVRRLHIRFPVFPLQSKAFALLW